MYKDIIHENRNWQMPVLRDMLKISLPFAIIKKTKELRNAVFCMCRRISWKLSVGYRKKG